MLEKQTGMDSVVRYPISGADFAVHAGLAAIISEFFK